jgi:hypothetical protein
MAVMMNMSSNEIECDPMKAEYGEEAMCAGWNPAVALVCQQQMLVPTDSQMTMPADLVTVDAESFLQRMYTYQR